MVNIDGNKLTQRELDVIAGGDTYKEKRQLFEADPESIGDDALNQIAAGEQSSSAGNYQGDDNMSLNPRTLK